MTRKNMKRSHFLLPDVQAKDNLNFDHLTAAGNYIVNKKPNVIICIGDFGDLPSLSMYDVAGSKTAEGQRYSTDIKAVHRAMEAFLAPIKQYNGQRKKNKKKLYKPEMYMCLGNHENRIDRAIEKNPRAYEGVISTDDLKYAEYGWTVVPFLEILHLDGVAYSHYFYQPMTGKPYGGTAVTRLTNIGFTYTMGHVQGKGLAEKYLANGNTIRGLFAGSYYQHEEKYKGFQANDHWRGCIYKTEVADGDYCLCELSLDYLMRRWL